MSSPKPNKSFTQLPKSDSKLIANVTSLINEVTGNNTILNAAASTSPKSTPALVKPPSVSEVKPICVPNQDKTLPAAENTSPKKPKALNNAEKISITGVKPCLNPSPKTAHKRFNWLPKFINYNS